MKIKTLPKAKTAHTPLPAPAKAAAPKQTSKPQQASISPAELKQWLEKAKDLPDIRWSKVKAVREAILAEGFDTDERLAQLADLLPSELFEQ